MVSVLILVLLSHPVAGAGAADEIKVDLKAGKYQSVVEGSTDLVGYSERDERAFFFTNGSVDLTVKVPEAGEYVMKVKASCQAALKEFAKMTIVAGNKSVADDFALTQEAEKEYTFTAKLAAGEQKISISYTNDDYKEGEYDRNLYLHAVSLKKK